MNRINELKNRGIRKDGKESIYIYCSERYLECGSKEQFHEGKLVNRAWERGTGKVNLKAEKLQCRCFVS